MHEATGSRRSRASKRAGKGLGLVVATVGAAFIITLPLGRAGTGAAGESPTFHPIGSAVAVGEPAPELNAADGSALLLDLDGHPIHLGDFAGRPLWIVFWATWCTPCQQEAPDIRAAFHAHADDQLAVLAIDLQEPTTAVRDYARAHDLDYTIGLDPTAAVMALYRARGLPAHLFVDGSGVIRARYSGQLTRELMEQYLAVITPG